MVNTQENLTKISECGGKHMQTKYDALSIAKYLLSLDPNREYFNNKEVKNEITSTTIIIGNFHLNQMLYLLQIFYYLKYKQPLFKDSLYAWENGMIVYGVYTRFWGLYHGANSKEIKDIEDKETKSFITKCFNYLKTTSDEVLQEFAYTDPVWSSTWGRRPQPDIHFTDKENLEIYQKHCSRWLQGAKL